MNLEKIDSKKAQMESQSVVVWIFVIAVVIMGILFVRNMNWDAMMKNMPGFEGPGEEDREIDVDLTIEICPRGYEIIGELKGTKNPYSFFLKDGSSIKDTNLKWNLGNNKIEIQKRGFLNDIQLGDNLPDYHQQNKVTYRFIEIESQIFQRESNKYLEVLKEELRTGKEIFKTLLLIDKALIRGNNQICQKTTRISEENMRKGLNTIYWGVEEPVKIDLILETTQLIQKEDHSEQGYFKLNIEDYISGTKEKITYLDSNGVIRTQENKGIYIREEGERTWIFIFSKDTSTPSGKISASHIGEISKADGRIIIFCNDDGELQGQNYIRYSLQPGTIRLPDKAVFRYNPPWITENGGYSLRCNTTIFLSIPAIQIAMNPPLTRVDQQYYSSSGANSIPTKVRSH